MARTEHLCFSSSIDTFKIRCQINGFTKVTRLKQLPATINDLSPTFSPPAPEPPETLPFSLVPGICTTKLNQDKKKKDLCCFDLIAYKIVWVDLTTTRCPGDAVKKLLRSHDSFNGVCKGLCPVSFE